MFILVARANNLAMLIVRYLQENASRHPAKANIAEGGFTKVGVKLCMNEECNQSCGKNK